MNGIETIEVRFLCTFSQNQKMGTMEPSNVPSTMKENKRTIQRMGNRLRWPKSSGRGLGITFNGCGKASRYTSRPNTTTVNAALSYLHALAKPRQNDAATVRNMLAQLYKLLQVNPVLTLELWLIHFRTVGHLSFGFLVTDHQLINMLYQLYQILR